MALDELEEAGVLLPKDEWGRHKVKTTVKQIPFGIALFVAVAGLSAAYIGGGKLLTWIGIGFFLVAFFIILWMCDRAVMRQRKRFKNEKKEIEN